MSITVLYAGTRPWEPLIKDLADKFDCSPQGLLNLVDVWAASNTRRDIFLVNPNFLLLGPEALQFFLAKRPKGFRLKEIGYGAKQPKLYLIDTELGLSQFSLVLAYDSYTGKDAFNGCVFLHEAQPLRAKLFAHLANRVFAPHEPSIFDLAASALPTAPGSRGNATISRFKRVRAAPVGRPPEDPSLRR